jgi:hypothetical protein
MKTTSLAVPSLLLVPLLASAALFGCSSPSAGSRPHDAGMDFSPPQRDAQAVDYYCAADAMGGGVCPINFCGTLPTTSSLPSNAYGTSGADSICNGGRVCIVGAPVPAGNAFQLTCLAPASGALAYGAACSTTVAGMHCADDSLCVTSPDVPGAFCSTMCRNDADCPTSSSCLEYTTVPAPNGSTAKVGYCTPSSKIAATSCARESDCQAKQPDGGAPQGCVPYGTRTALTVCRALPAGGTKTVGTKCGSSAECLSGACYDRNFTLNGGSNRTYCTAVCAVNSDCGPDQMCTRLVQNNNGTPSDPTDDVVAGECQTLFVPVGVSGCGIDADCVALANGSDTCDATHGLCYNKAAVPGSPCTLDSGCMLGGVCSGGQRFPGGYCQTFGCAPNPTGSTPAVDLCAGAGSTCVQRGAPDAPLHACYDGCQLGSDAGALMCLRAGFVCSSPADNQPASICLGQTGT